MSTTEFNSMGLKPELLTMIKEKGFSRPTPIQVKTIPLALAGSDIMGQAQTGTGKTAAFGLPILNKITKGGGVQALVLCPTRELAVQVSKEILFLGRLAGIRVLAVYGGQSIERQIKTLEGFPEIIIATPGRLLDHMRRRTLSLAKLQFVVIDEADEMLDMGFFPDIEKILKSCPAKRQTLLFSATLEYEVRKMGMRFMIEPEVVAIKSPERTVPEIDQSYYPVHPALKVESIAQIMSSMNPTISLIFCRTKKGVDELAHRLKALGYETDALHGDMSQRERDTVMYRFRQKKTKVLIATDLAARGLDISHVTHVFNYDIPEDCESYVHRIGRTGRAGKTGTAITLVEPEQIKHLRAIEKFIGKRIPQESLASMPDNKADTVKLMLESRINGLTKRKSSLSAEVANDLLQKYDALDLVTNLVTMLIGDIAEPEANKNKVSEVRNYKERSTRKSLPPRQPKEIKEVNDLDIVNIEVPVGKRALRNKRQLIDYILTNTTVTEKQIGDIEVEDDFTFIEVPMNKVDEVYNALAYFKPGWHQVTNEEHRRPRVPVSK